MAKSLISFAIFAVANAVEYKNELPAGEPNLFAIQSKGVIVDLFDTFSDLGLYFSDQSLPFPDSFEFPRSFEFKAVVGTVTKKSGQTYVYNGAQEMILDAVNNRVKIHRINKVFREPDQEV